jgi:hypothetical protein
MEVICPCSKEELEYVVKFLYAGEINCCEEIDSFDILENLHDIFGFPRNLSLENPNQSNDVCILS